MGRQVCFFASPTDIETLFTQVFDDEYYLFDSNGEKILFQQFMEAVLRRYNGQNSYGSVYISKRGFKLVYTESGLLDFIKSEVIQFHACSPVPKRVADYSSIHKRFEKGGFVVIDDDELFRQLLSDFEKNPVYKENPRYVVNGFEHGRFWCSPCYYDESGRKIMKSKELTTLFSKIARYIRRHYRLSTTKFAYIAPDAYPKYEERAFIPCAVGNPVEFRIK